jgi:hypothetical protein
MGRKVEKNIRDGDIKTIGLLCGRVDVWSLNVVCMQLVATAYATNNCYSYATRIGIFELTAWLS